MERFIEQGPTPPYLQLENMLRKNIENGEFEFGSPLLSEQELMNICNVSRTTVRQAFNRLSEDKTVVKVQGKGAFVMHPEIKQELIFLRTLSEVLTSTGFVPEVRVQGVETNPKVPPHVLIQLQVEPDESIVRVIRQHFVEGKPIAYAVIYLSGKFNWRFSAEDLTHQSIYSWLEERTEIMVDSGFHVIKAMAAKPEVANALNIEPGEPVLHVENTSTTTEGVPIEHTEFYFPPERYALTVSLRRTHTGVSLENVRAGLSARSDLSNEFVNEFVIESNEQGVMV